MKWLNIAVYCIVAIVIFCLFTYFTINILLKHQENIVCPDLRGKTVDEARRIVENQGLSLAILRYERRNDIPFNHITVQKPDANMNIRKGRTVSVIVSEGPKIIPVPSLTGLSLRQAEDILAAKRLKVGKIIYVPHSKPGRVVAQFPKGGESILEEKSVTLFAGIQQKTYFLMPEINDKNMSDILEEMTMKNIKYKTSYIAMNRNLAQKILTSIPPKTIFEADEEILIQINMGGL